MNNEEKKVRLRIVSRMVDPQGGRHDTKNARTGKLLEMPGGLRLEYDDEQDGERAHIVLELTPGNAAQKSCARMQRKGMTSGLLSFVPGQRISTSYVTIYGDIPIQIATRRVEIAREENGGMLLLDYDVYMGGERTSSALMEITWRL